MDLNLLLWRHAKTEIGFHDHDRNLTKRGKSDANIVGKYILENTLSFKILTSSSNRTVQTTKTLLDLSFQKNNFQIIEDLYLASDDEMKDIIFSYKKESQNIICIAHNPGIHQLALSLVKKSSIDPKFEKINHKYPTAALAVIKIKDGNWENLYNNQNELIDFITPKDLKH
ncbi:MAG: SixA phosphatase family protein [Alphaproteobacteria bacterium]|jgi:phosphohistidine phosphatase|tara:strand:+ start:1284 stop:1796 length:513 start_codon:yes stop_codon:yes gene_type:complete